MQQERLLEMCTATTDSEEFHFWIGWCLVVLLEWHVPSTPWAMNSGVPGQLDLEPDAVRTRVVLHPL